MRRKWFGLGLLGVLSVGLLSGCSKEYTSAEDLLKAYQKEAHDNYAVSGSMNVTIGASVVGTTMSIPIDLTIDADIAGTSMHGTVETSISMMGQSQAQTTELYVDGEDDGTVYLSDGTTGWITDTSDMASLFEMPVNEAVFDGASIEHQEGVYVVIQSMQTMLDNSEALNLFTEDNAMLSEFNLSQEDYQAILDAMGESNVVYTFDEETLDCQSVVLEEASGSVETEMSGMSVNMNFSMSMDMTYDAFGEITDEMVAVPDDVKAEAAGPVDNPEDVEEEAAMPKVSEELNSGMVNGFSMETDLSSVPEGFAGTYQGTELDVITPWSVFEADGWTFDESTDGKYSFVIAENEKYPAVTLRLYNRSRMDATSKEIVENGCYGYSISSVDSTSAYPDMSWEGVSFGASREEVEAVFGEPILTSDSGSYGSTAEAITYYADGQGSVQITFRFTDDALYGVDLETFA